MYIRILSSLSIGAFIFSRPSQAGRLCCPAVATAMPVAHPVRPPYMRNAGGGTWPRLVLALILFGCPGAADGQQLLSSCVGAPVPELPADSAPDTHVYSLSGSTQIPSYGNLHMSMHVELTEIGRDPHGTKLVQLAIPQAPTLVDRAGNRHALLRPPYRVHEHSFFYRQTARGRLLDVLHHPDESPVAVDMKRELACAHQFVGVADAARRIRQRRLSQARVFTTQSTWSALELDSGGTAMAHYTMHGHERGWRVHKRLLYTHDDECAPQSRNRARPPPSQSQPVPRCPALTRSRGHHASSG